MDVPYWNFLYIISTGSNYILEEYVVKKTVLEAYHLQYWKY